MRSCQFNWDATRQGVAYLRILFPEPAINPEVVSGESGPEGNEICTLSVNPLQGARFFPSHDGTSFGTPCRSARMVGIGRGV